MRYILLFFALIITSFSYSQGCSDAGFCTMGAMKPDQGYNRRIQVKLRSIEFTHYVGLTRFKDVVYNYVADVNVGLNSKTTVQFKVPYVFVDGALANTRGIGDLSLALTRNIITREAFQINATVGSKIPTGDSNIKNTEGQSLPMYNQTGLGTYDAVAGISFITSKWLLATGIQRPFGQINSTFLWSDWIGDPLEKKALEYTQARSLVRGTDIMFRVERNFRFTNFNFSTGLLPIYRINKDMINIPVLADGEVVGYKDKIIDGSEGLALTLLVSGGYQFNTRLGLKVINGFRLVKRHTNPDGLSREYVNNVSLIYKF
jgi:hypothetical protein